MLVYTLLLMNIIKITSHVTPTLCVTIIFVADLADTMHAMQIFFLFLFFCSLFYKILTIMENKTCVKFIIY